MARLNLTEAAKAAKVSRSTLYRHIKEGRISRTLNNNDEPEIDTSELMRVYGSLGQRYSTVEQPLVHNETEDKTQELEHEIELLKLKLSHTESLKKQAEEDKIHWRAQAEQLTLMLERKNDLYTATRFKRFMDKLER